MLFVKESLKYATFPDGTPMEFYRGGSGQTEQGWQYCMIQLDQIMLIADHQARAGDRELYDYVTSDGYYNYKGGAKSLKLVMQAMIKYVDHSWMRYVANQGNNNYLIDAIAPLEGKHYVFDTWVAQSNLYYKDLNMTGVYTRKKSGTSPYPATATGSGSNNAWTGGFGMVSGKLFMFGQMEGKVFPYPGARPQEPKPPVVEPPVVVVPKDTITPPPVVEQPKDTLPVPPVVEPPVVVPPVVVTPVDTASTHLVLTITTKSVSCYGGKDGFISLEVTGGIAPYRYIWTNTSTSNSISNLVAGSYSVMVTDAKGVKEQVSIVIVEPKVI